MLDLIFGVGSIEREVEPQTRCYGLLGVVAASRAFQFTMPKLSFQSLITPSRKFTLADPGASAGLRPHLKQEVIFAK